ncbi:hypothetical protein HHK36_008455 [Tetracentron sinense]|uniref:Autophagy-related protein 101 n=1 Tax=Tetracentron sinense TaxID=13715 RepID=A0A835DJC5_TETSI|nr:hypothetical protein HHK36_008455 [Tetracentron sinense]
MNCEVCHLKELEVEHFEIREVLRWLRCFRIAPLILLGNLYKSFSSSSYASGLLCLQFRCYNVIYFLPEPTMLKLDAGILHSIVFHRALGPVRPKDVDSELFEITYVQCGDSNLEKKIEEKIDHFIGWVEKHPNKKSQVYSLLLPKLFSNKIERLYWEHWYVNLNVAQPPKAPSRKSHHSKVVVDPGESALEERNVRRTALEVSLREVLFQIIKFVNEKKDHIPPIPNLEGVSFPYEITIPSSSDSSFGMDMIKRMLQTGRPTMLS